MFLNENDRIPFQISLKWIPMSPIDEMATLVREWPFFVVFASIQTNIYIYILTCILMAPRNIPIPYFHLPYFHVSNCALFLRSTLVLPFHRCKVNHICYNWSPLYRAFYITLAEMWCIFFLLFVSSYAIPTHSFHPLFRWPNNQILHIWHGVDFKVIHDLIKIL